MAFLRNNAVIRPIAVNNENPDQMKHMSKCNSQSNLRQWFTHFMSKSLA